MFSRKECVFESCECRGHSSILKNAIHKRDRAMFRRSRVAKNSMESDILGQVVRYLKEEFMSAEELEERIDGDIYHWTSHLKCDDLFDA